MLVVKNGSPHIININTRAVNFPLTRYYNTKNKFLYWIRIFCIRVSYMRIVFHEKVYLVVLLFEPTEHMNEMKSQEQCDNVMPSCCVPLFSHTFLLLLFYSSILLAKYSKRSFLFVQFDCICQSLTSV